METKTQDQPANVAAPETKGGCAATIGSAPSCRPGCGHTSGQHEAFDAGLKLGEGGKDVYAIADRYAFVPLWREAWLTGHSVGQLNYRHAQNISSKQ